MIRNAFDIAVFNHHFSKQGPASVGTDFVLSPPSNNRSELIAMSFSLDTDANAGNRTVRLHFKRGVNDLIVGCAAVSQIANTIFNYVVGQHGTFSTASDVDSHFIAIPSLPILLETDTIESEVVNIEAGDQIGWLTFVFKTWTYEH